MNILHSKTDPTLLARLKEMLGSSARADIAVGYFFIGGFGAVAQDLARLDKVRILVGRTDRQVLEEVALGIQQTQALRARLDADSLVQRRQRGEIAQQAVDHIAEGVAVLPQEKGTEATVSKLRDMVAVRRVEVRGLSQKSASRQGLPVLVRQPRRARLGSRRIIQPYAGWIHRKH